MRKVLLCLVFLVVLTACPGPLPPGECAVDDDCVRGGCSGTICQAKDADPILTTCEYKEEYGCFADINCGCVNNRCGWQETQEFSNCIEQARGS